MMMGFGALFSVLFIVLVLGAIAYALGWLPQASRQVRNDTRESALDILKQRYASGEISKAEYEEMRDDLAS
jgi:putative membrane protein